MNCRSTSRPIPIAIRTFVERWVECCADPASPHPKLMVDTQARIDDLATRLLKAERTWPKAKDAALLIERARHVERAVHGDRVWRDLIGTRGPLGTLPAAASIKDNSTAAALRKALASFGAQPSHTEMLEGARRAVCAIPFEADLVSAYATRIAARMTDLDSPDHLRDAVLRAHSLMCWEAAIADMRGANVLDVGAAGAGLAAFIADDAGRDATNTLEVELRARIVSDWGNNAVDRVVIELTYQPARLGDLPHERAFAEVVRLAVRMALGLRCLGAHGDAPPALADRVEAAFGAARIARDESPADAAHRLRRRRYTNAAAFASVGAVAAAVAAQISSLASTCAQRFEEAFARGVTDGSLARAEKPLLAELRAICVDALPNVVALVRDATVGSLTLDKEAFWSELPSALADPPQSLSFWEQHLPDHAAVEDVGRGMSAITDALTPRSMHYDVFRRIQDLDLGDREWAFGDIEFFDPAFRRTSFDGWLLRDKGKAVVARVPVLARGPDEAKRLADAKLGVALDVITFGMSAFNDYRGLAPQVEEKVSMLRADCRGFGGSKSSKHARTFDEPTGNQIHELLKDYAGVATAWAQGKDYQLPNLEAKARAALSWYRRARWQPDLTRRALEYWIALEHLFFVGGKSAKNALKSDAARRAALLHVTWRDLPQADDYRRVLGHAVRPAREHAAVRAALDADPDLASWDLDDAVLLDVARMRRFSAIIVPAAGAAVGPILETHVTAFRMNEPVVLELLTAMRWDVQYVLEEVQAARNGMVHEAQSLAGHQRAAADLLEHVVEDAILKVVQHVFVGVGDSIEAVVERVHCPFRSPTPF